MSSAAVLADDHDSFSTPPGVPDSYESRALSLVRSRPELFRYPRRGGVLAGHVREPQVQSALRTVSRLGPGRGRRRQLTLPLAPRPSAILQR